jgi:hypothetical protein
VSKVHAGDVGCYSDVSCAPAGLFWPAAVLLLLSWIVLLAGALLVEASQSHPLAQCICPTQTMQCR